MIKHANHSNKPLQRHLLSATLLGSALLLSCCPPATRPRPEPRARPRRVQTEPLTQMRSAMRGWIKKLKTADKLLDLATVFRKSAGKPVGFPVDIRCQGKGDRYRFEVASTKDLTKPAAAGSHAALPTFFVHLMPAPSVASPAERKMYPTPPRNCLVRAVRVKGRLTLVAKPLKLDEQDASIDKVTFFTRGACHFLQLSTSYMSEASPETEEEHSESGEEHSQSGERIRLWSLRDDETRDAGDYARSEEERSPPGYSDSASGSVTWMELGGFYLLYYRSHEVTSFSSSTYRREAVERKIVEKLTPGCELERLLPDELMRIRKLPGGARLPTHQIDPQDD